MPAGSARNSFFFFFFTSPPDKSCASSQLSRRVLHLNNITESFELYLCLCKCLRTRGVRVVRTFGDRHGWGAAAAAATCGSSNLFGHGGCHHAVCLAADSLLQPEMCKIIRIKYKEETKKAQGTWRRASWSGADEASVVTIKAWIVEIPKEEANLRALVCVVIVVMVIGAGGHGRLDCSESTRRQAC